MRNKLLFGMLAGTAILYSCNITTGQSNIKYTHLSADGKNMPVSSFNAIKANGVFNIILTHGDAESVVVKDDYPEDLKVTNDGSTLVIIDTVSNHNGGNHNTNIYITYKQLNSIETEAVGDVKTTDTLKTSKFTFESNGVGESTLVLNADSLTASENGVGALIVSGKAHYANIEDNGVGTLKAKDFKVHILHASVNGVGAAKVYADSLLYLNVSGVGGLTYYGTARIMEQNSSGIGKVEKGD